MEKKKTYINITEIDCGMLDYNQNKEVQLLNGKFDMVEELLLQVKQKEQEIRDSWRHIVIYMLRTLFMRVPLLCLVVKSRFSATVYKLRLQELAFDTPRVIITEKKPFEHGTISYNSEAANVDNLREIIYELLKGAYEIHSHNYDIQY